MNEREVRISAARYVDYDDCLAAAAAEYSAAHDLAGWDLAPRWDDEQRDEIILTVPAREWCIADRPDTAVTVGNWTGQIDAARALMDDEIAESIHGTVDNDQDFVDAYSEAHRAKYGVDFVVN